MLASSNGLAQRTTVAIAVVAGVAIARMSHCGYFSRPISRSFQIELVLVSFQAQTCNCRLFSSIYSRC